MKNQEMENVIVGGLVKRMMDGYVGVIPKELGAYLGVPCSLIDKIRLSLMPGENWNVYGSGPNKGVCWLTYGGVVEVIYRLQEDNVITCEKATEVINQLLVLPAKADKMSLKEVFQRIGRLHKEVLS